MVLLMHEHCMSLWRLSRKLPHLRRGNYFLKKPGPVLSSVKNAENNDGVSQRAIKNQIIAKAGTYEPSNSGMTRTGIDDPGSNFGILGQEVSSIEKSQSNALGGDRVVLGYLLGRLQD